MFILCFGWRTWVVFGQIRLGIVKVLFPGDRVDSDRREEELGRIQSDLDCHGIVNIFVYLS